MISAISSFAGRVGVAWIAAGLLIMALGLSVTIESLRINQLNAEVESLTARVNEVVAQRELESIQNSALKAAIEQQNRAINILKEATAKQRERAEQLLREAEAEMVARAKALQDLESAAGQSCQDGIELIDKELGL